MQGSHYILPCSIAECVHSIYTDISEAGIRIPYQSLAVAK